MLTPTLTGSGDRFHLLTREVGLATHVRDIEETLVHEDVSSAILVGHSYGGTVITGAAARAPDRIKALIYLDAQAPAHAQTGSGASGDATSDRLAELASGDGWLLDPLPLDAVGITDPADVAWVGPRRHAHPMRTLLEPVDAVPSALADIAKVYIACRRHDALVRIFGVDPLAAFQQRARHEGWALTEIDAPHDAMIVAPDLVVEALLTHA